MGRVAILEPTTTLWSLFTNPFDDYAYGGEDEDERREHERVRDAWRRARRALFHAQISFDHLDPEMLALAEAEGGELRVGSAVYTVVIVTHSHVAEPETLEKLRRFRSGGGCVCLFGDAPSRLTDGKPLREAFPASIRAEDEDTLCRIALENAPMPVQLCLSAEGRTSCVSCLRETESAEPWLFVANQEGGCVRGTLRLRGDLTGVERIHRDGRPPQALRADAEGVVPFEMGPYEAAWFRALRLCAEPAAEPAILRLEIRGDMSCRLLGRNLLRMEQAQVRMHGAEWTRLPLRPYGLLREALGALEAGSWRASSGFGLPRKLQFRYPHTYQARMTFHAEFCPPDLALFYERESLLGEASVSLNGTPLPPPRTQGDQVVFPIAHAVRVGSNELVFSVTVRHDWEGLLDAVFLRGDFSLSGRTLRPPVRTCECSCAYPEGAPFYSGAIEWSTRFDAGEAQGAEWLELSSDAPLVDCIALEINGQPIGARVRALSLAIAARPASARG